MKIINILSLIISLCLFAVVSCKDDDVTPKDDDTTEKPKTFIDSRDGQEYGQVKIGDQVWMSENLNYNPRATGGLYYNNDSLTNHVYGRLYLWETFMKGASSSTKIPSGVQGLCPEGWHFPSIAEWDILITYMNSKKLDGRDMMDTVLWANINTPTNSTGFSARPAGTMYGEGNSSAHINDYTHFMSSTGTPGSVLSGISVNSGGGFKKETNLGVYNYWSCRCLKD